MEERRSAVPKLAGLKPVLADIDGLPGFTTIHFPEGPCVYFLMLDGVVVYVGQTTDLLNRLAGHRKAKRFNEVRYILCLKRQLDSLEARWIHALKPPLNITYPTLRRRRKMLTPEEKSQRSIHRIRKNLARMGRYGSGKPFSPELRDSLIAEFGPLPLRDEPELDRTAEGVQP